MCLERATAGKSNFHSVRDNSSLSIKRYDYAVSQRNEPNEDLYRTVSKPANRYTQERPMVCRSPIRDRHVPRHSLLPRHSMTCLYNIELDSISPRIAVLTCPLGYCIEQFPSTLWPTNFQSASIFISSCGSASGSW